MVRTRTLKRRVCHNADGLVRFPPPAAKIPAIDIILLFAAAEGDLPKIEEVRGFPCNSVVYASLIGIARPISKQICNAGADVNVKDLSGNTPLVRHPLAFVACLSLGSDSLPHADAGWQEQPAEEGGHRRVVAEIREEIDAGQTNNIQSLVGQLCALLGSLPFRRRLPS
jgi:hypothetical protein